MRVRLGMSVIASATRAMVATLLKARPLAGPGKGDQSIDAATQPVKTRAAIAAGRMRTARTLGKMRSLVASITPAIIIRAPTGSSVNINRRDITDATGSATTSTARPSRNRK